MRIVVPETLGEEYRRAGDDRLKTVFAETYAFVEAGKSDEVITKMLVDAGWSPSFAAWIMRESVSSEGNPTFMDTTQNRGSTLPWAPVVFVFSIIALLAITLYFPLIVNLEGRAYYIAHVSAEITAFVFVVWAGLQLKRNRRR